jgi:predicted ester cyclase
MRATHRHEYEGIPATGRGITITGITFLRLEEGRIVDDRFESGSPSPAEQLAGT